jgi:hypothetical protein
LPRRRWAGLQRPETMSHGLSDRSCARGRRWPRWFDGDLRSARPASLQHLANYQRKERKPLNAIEINEDIVNRLYQIEAIKRVGERFSGKHRRALVVQATGTGKTRVAIALTDLLIRARWVKRVLFLCYRRASSENRPRTLLTTSCQSRSASSRPGSVQTRGKNFSCNLPGDAEGLSVLRSRFLRPDYRR